jgi:hypothetical protein
MTLRVAVGESGEAIRGRGTAGKSGCAVPRRLIRGIPRAGRSVGWACRVLRERSRLRRAAWRHAMRRLPIGGWSGELRRCLPLTAGNVRAIWPRHATREGRGTTVSATRNAWLWPADTGTNTGTKTRPAETGCARAGCAEPGCAMAALGADATVRTGPAIATRSAI